MVQNITRQYRAVQNSIVCTSQYTTVYYSTVNPVQYRRYSPLYNGGVQCTMVRYNTVWYRTRQYDAVRYSIMQYNTIWSSTTQGGAVVQGGAVQCSVANEMSCSLT